MRIWPTGLARILRRIRYCRLVTLSRPTLALDVAAYFLRLAAAEGRKLDQLATLKLLYFAQGTALARFGQPLFYENLKAWPMGPVVPAVWQKTKVYGSGAVGALDGAEPDRLSDSERAIIECAWAEYGHLDSRTLVKLTHAPGTPWKAVRDALGLTDSEECSEPIPQHDIREHFRQELPPPLTEEEKRHFLPLE